MLCLNNFQFYSRHTRSTFDWLFIWLSLYCVMWLILSHCFHLQTWSLRSTLNLIISLQLSLNVLLNCPSLASRLTSGFSGCLKSSFVVPISRRTSDHSQCWTISLLPLFGKVLQSVINTQGLLSAKQYSFYFSKSTANVLTVIAEGVC